MPGQDPIADVFGPEVAEAFPVAGESPTQRIMKFPQRLGAAMATADAIGDPNIPTELAPTIGARNPATPGQALLRLGLEGAGAWGGSGAGRRLLRGGVAAAEAGAERAVARLGSSASVEAVKDLATANRAALTAARRQTAAGIIGAGPGGAAGAAAAEGISTGEFHPGDLPETIGFNMLGEGGGRLATHGVSKLWSALPLTRLKIRPWVAKFKPGGESAYSSMVAAGQMPPADILIENSLAEEIGAVARAGVLSGPKYRAAQRGAVKSAEKSIDQFAEQLAGRSGSLEAEFVVQHALQNSDKIFQLTQRQLREGLIGSAGAAPIVDMTQTLRQVGVLRRTNQLGLDNPQVNALLSATARPTTAKIVTAEAVESGGGLVRTETPRSIYDRRGRTAQTWEMGPPTREMVERTTTAPISSLRSGNIDFEQGFTIWSDLIDRARSNTPAGRAAQKLADTLEADLRHAAERRSDDFLRDFDSVVAFEKDGAGPFNKALLGKFINAADPMTVGTMLHGRSAAMIRETRQLLEREIGAGRSDPRSWHAVQASWLHRKLSDATVGELDQTISGKKLLEGVRQAEADKTLLEVFPSAEERQQLKILATVLARVEKTPGERLGSVAIRLTQFGAIINLATAPTRTGDENLLSYGTGTGGVLGSGAILLTPLAFAAALKNPRVVRALAYGSVATPGTRQAMHGTARLYAGIEEMISNGLITDEDVKYEGSASLAAGYYQSLRSPKHDQTLGAARLGSRGQ